MTKLVLSFIYTLLKHKVVSCLPSYPIADDPALYIGNRYLNTMSKNQDKLPGKNSWNWIQGKIAYQRYAVVVDRCRESNSALVYPEFSPKSDWEHVIISDNLMNYMI